MAFKIRRSSNTKFLVGALFLSFLFIILAATILPSLRSRTFITWNKVEVYHWETTLADGWDLLVALLIVELDAGFGYFVDIFLPKLGIFEVEEGGLFAISQEEHPSSVFQFEPLDVDRLHWAISLKVNIIDRLSWEKYLHRSRRSISCRWQGNGWFRNRKFCRSWCIRSDGSWWRYFWFWRVGYL